MSQQTLQHTDWSCTPKCKFKTEVQNKIKTTKKGDRFDQSVSKTFSKIENNKQLTYTH